MRRLLLSLGFVTLASLSHALVVWVAPYVATDRVVAGIARTREGFAPNRLSFAAPASPSRDVVPMSNPDTVVASSWLDLDAGPLVFTADPPSEAVYWSVSIFAHDSDTDFILSDRDLTARGDVRVLILGPGQAQPESLEADHVARLSTRRGFLLVRAIMRDRNDAAHVAALTEQMRDASLGPVR